MKLQSGKVLAIAGALVLAVCSSVIGAGFSADMITKMGATTMKQKIAISGKMMRMENPAAGGTVTIMRGDKRVVWIVTPSQKSYMEVKQTKAQSAPASIANAKELEKMAKKKELGTEKVAGYVCNKTRYTFNDKRRGTMTIWLSGKLGFPLKSEMKSPKGVTTTTQCTNIKEGVPSSLFQVPKGYKKITMPTMGPGMKGMRGMPKMPK